MSITIPNTFNDGELIVASKFNENFTAVKAGVDANTVDIATLQNSITSYTPGMFGGNIQTALDSIPSGSTLIVSNLGTITVTATLTVSKPVTIVVENTTFTSNMSSPQWQISSSNVTIISPNKTGKFISTYPQTTVGNNGNLIQWGTVGVDTSYTDLTIRGIDSTMPVVTSISAVTRTSINHIVSWCNSINESPVTASVKNRLTVEDCVFRDGNCAISCERTDNIIVKNNVALAPVGQLIFMWDCNDYLIDGNSLIDPNWHSTNLNESLHTGSFSAGTNYGRIVNNYVDGTKYEAIQVRGIGTVCSNNVIVNAKGTGINIQDPDGVTVTCKNVVVTNNRIHVIGGGVGGSGIAVASKVGTSVYPIETTISDNNITLAGDTCAFGVVAGGDGHKIMNNSIRNTATSPNATADGIYIGTSSTNCTISGNLISGFGRNGVYLNIVTGAIVTGNLSQNNSTNGFLLGGTTNCILGENVSINNGSWGYVINGTTTGTVVHQDNSFFNNTSGGINTLDYHTADGVVRTGTAAETTMTPRYIGDEYFKTDTQKWYKAKGLTTSDWIILN